jgi:SPP1 gp7 family putative phage head morphogenesis protein
MLQGILQGDSIPELAKRLATNVSDSNYKAAVRNARTMATSAQNAGRYGSYRRAKGMGIDLTIEWAAVLDNRTRHSHRQMHGQRREVDEPFTITDGGRTFNIMWPADCNSSQSNAPQREIWNCRCTLLSWVKGFEHDMQTDSDKMNMSFDEWLQVEPGKEEFLPIISQYEKGQAIKMQYIREYKYG